LHHLNQNAPDVQIKNTNGLGFSVGAFKIAVKLNELLPNLKHVEVRVILLYFGKNLLTVETFDQIVDVLGLGDFEGFEVC